MADEPVPNTSTSVSEDSQSANESSQLANPVIPDPLGSSTDTEPEVSTQGADPEKAPTPVKDEKDPASTEPFVWDGGVDNLPKELQDRGKGMLDHMHKVTQEAAQVKREADAYTQLTNHPEFREFLEWQDKKKDSLPPAGPASPGISEEELLEAQTSPQHFETLINKRIDAAVQPLAKEAMTKINQLTYELSLQKHERELESFGKTHDGFEDMMKDKARSSVMHAIVQDVVGRNKGTLEDAWTQYQSLDKSYLDKAQSQINKTIKSKRAAVTASPSKPGSPEVIYVDNSKEATRVAFEHAQRGKHVDVRVRRDKK